MTAPLKECWDALGGDAGALASASVEANAAYLASPLPVGALADATVTAALLAAAELAEVRGRAGPRVRVGAEHVAAAFRSERSLRVDGAEPAGAGFAPLSRFLPAVGGWIRLHANYPHHQQALLRVLGLAEPDPDRVAAAVAGWLAVELEATLADAGGCAAAVREEETWRASSQGSALAKLPLLDFDADGSTGATVRSLPDVAAGQPPAHGVRVLDMTRVIAGPVGTRMLAALGADVLRVDSPNLPELPLQSLDTGPGKRSTLVGLHEQAGRETLEGLLTEADVLVQGYRPGALAEFGLDADAVQARHPHLVTVTLSAWGQQGPWAYRRGFDSLVQAATGIAAATSTGPAPGTLPAQALDHGTGYLIAAAALRGLAVRQRTGRAPHARLALARTAMWLLGMPRKQGVAAGEPAAEKFRVTFKTTAGEIGMITPPGTLDGRAPRWSHGPRPWGGDKPEWAS
ncbi:MAG: CoA transferase [Streptosporangiales bacterium]